MSNQSKDDVPRNQCDGCAAGIPVDENGNHRMGKPGGYADLMGCTKDRYLPSKAWSPGLPPCRVNIIGFCETHGNYWAVCRAGVGRE